MTVYYEDESVTVHAGDCLDVLRGMPDASVDAVVTDPPYGLEFMGREWDGADGFRRSLDLADVGRDNVFGRTSRTSPEYRAGTLFQSWCEQWATECLRVLKPGGHLLAFGGTRTWHRLACAIEDAGFEMRDSIAWLYGSGFPKSLDVSKAIDRARNDKADVLAVTSRLNGRKGTPGEAWDQREKIGEAAWSNSANHFVPGEDHTQRVHLDLTAPATDDARTWQGWGTALKPAFEPIVVGRKPLAGTVAANVLAHGTGALNVDGCRVGSDTSRGDRYNGKAASPSGGVPDAYGEFGPRPNLWDVKPGRWPANVVLDESQAAELDRQSGDVRAGGHVAVSDGAEGTASIGPTGLVRGRAIPGVNTYSDQGGASRFFYVHQEDPCDSAATTGDSTASSELARSARPTSPPPHSASTSGVPAADGFGPVGSSVDWSSTPIDALTTSRFRYEPKAPTAERPRDGQVAHPTVKPLDLMRWLVRLVTPPGGLVLDPFAGSGTTAEACVLEHMRCVTIEREPDYLPLIVARLSKPMQVGFDFDGGAA